MSGGVFVTWLAFGGNRDILVRHTTLAHCVQRQRLDVHVWCPRLCLDNHCNHDGGTTWFVFGGVIVCHGGARHSLAVFIVFTSAATATTTALVCVGHSLTVLSNRDSLSTSGFASAATATTTVARRGFVGSVLVWHGGARHSLTEFQRQGLAVHFWCSRGSYWVVCARHSLTMFSDREPEVSTDQLWCFTSAI